MAVYFIREGVGRGPIKIGYARDPEERRNTLQAANPRPLTIEASIPGDIGIERTLHQRFDAGRLCGEWFDYDTPGLYEFVSAAAHFEAFWPADLESPLILEVLDVIAPDLGMREKYALECLKWQAQQPGEPLAWPSPREALA